MAGHINLIDEVLRNYVGEFINDDLGKAVSYALFSGGKRMRPLLLLGVLADLGADVALGIRPAAAIEMVHTYSLIHDDLPAMDDDDFRRGLPSLHKKYGEALAILAGDALLTDAFSMIGSAPLADAVNLELIKLMSEYCGRNGMISGQVLDVLSANKKLNLSDIEEIYLRKTKDIISLAVISAVKIAGADPEITGQLEEFSRYFGLAFQIKDDLEDILISAGGKSDLITGKATYPIIIGVEPAKSIFNEYKNKALAIIKNTLGENKTFEVAAENL